MRFLAKLLPVSVVLLFVPGPVVADEATCDFFISSAPFTANQQGHYCLTQNIAYSSSVGAAITINANSVVLDLKGYKIGGQAAGLGTMAYGIYVTNQSTVVIRNGLVRGFYYGIFLADGSNNKNNIVDNIRADSNTRYGIYIAWPGENNTVRNCSVGSTGGTTVTSNWTMGIWIDSELSFAINNTVTNTAPADGGTVRYGLALGGYSRAVNNNVIGDGDTVESSNYCFDFYSTDLYRDNVASDCGTMYNSGISIGNNYP